MPKTPPRVPRKLAGVPKADRDPALIRYEFADRIVAWTPDGRWFVAGGDDFEEVWAEAKRLGYEQPLMEFVPPLTYRNFAHDESQVIEIPEDLWHIGNGR